MYKSGATTIVGIALLTGGCLGEISGSKGDDPRGPLEQGLPFVAVTRELPQEVMVQRAALVGAKALALQGPESFYLAINRSELGKKFFLTAYLKVLHPGGVDAGAAASLGTRVVTFRVQNGKLFVFDVRSDRATSDAFDPTLVIEAYPLVTGHPPFRVLPGNENYVLFDPSAGINRFHPLLSDAAEGAELPEPVQVDLSYLQAFRQIPDGATFEQVFAGTLVGGEERVRQRAWGTLGMAVRRYRESAGFEPFFAEEGKDRYFEGDILRERNTGGEAAPFLRWHIARGGQPIRFLISDQFQTLARERNYDIVGAVKAGVENWNQAFGFKAVEAVVARPGDSFAEDDKSYIILDRDPTLEYAFADLRYNPNTGEVRGASVYFSAFWVDIMIEQLDPPTMPNAKRATNKAAARPLRLAWGGVRPLSICQRGPSEPTSRQAKDALTPKQRVERAITHVVLHEVGHTLGLRHNFMGSLDPAHSSTMDYLLDEEAPLRATPGPYDVDAIKFLYGLAATPPKQRFCSDEAQEVDPLCAGGDTGDEPLGKHWIVRYQEAAKATLEEGEEILRINGLAAFVRAGTPADQGRAWEALFAPVKVGVDTRAGEMAHPGFTGRVSELQQVLLERLYLGPADDRGPISKDPVLEGATLAAACTEIRDTVTNRDKIRAWSTRRMGVDVLKKMQVQAAYEALLAARATLSGSRAGMPAGEVALVDDLVARIDRATKPYFDK
jgi:hypothetical protein